MRKLHGIQRASKPRQTVAATVIALLVLTTTLLSTGVADSGPLPAGNHPSAPGVKDDAPPADTRTPAKTTPPASTPTNTNTTAKAIPKTATKATSSQAPPASSASTGSHDKDDPLASILDRPEPQGPRDVLAESGIDAKQLQTLQDGRAMQAEESSVLHAILGCLPQFQLEQIDRWQKNLETEKSLLKNLAKYRGEFFQLSGHAIAAKRLKFSPKEATKYGTPYYYRLTLRLDGDGTKSEGKHTTEAIVFSREIPKAWTTLVVLGGPLDERVRCSGLFLKLGSRDEGTPKMFFASPRIAWFPERVNELLNATEAEQRLGQFGMDVSLFSNLRDRQVLGRPDRECFFQLLATAEQVPQAKLETWAGKDLDFQPLLDDPRAYRGQAVAVTGTIQSVTKILVDSKDIRQRTGVDYYYELEVSVPLSKTIEVKQHAADKKGTLFSADYTIVFCVRKLPPGVPMAENLAIPARCVGIFGKLLAREKPSPIAAFEVVRRINPLIIGRMPILLDRSLRPGGPQEQLRKFDIDLNRCNRIQDGQPLLPSENEVLLGLLGRFQELTLNQIARWVRDHVRLEQMAQEPAWQRAEFAHLTGRVIHIKKVTPPPLMGEQFLVPHYYRVTMRLTDPDYSVLLCTQTIPTPWIKMLEAGKPINERASCDGMFFKIGKTSQKSLQKRTELIFVSRRIAWHPDHVEREYRIHKDMVTLANLGMDVSLYETVRGGGKVTRKEGECFNQLLVAMGHVQPSMSLRGPVDNACEAFIKRPRLEQGRLVTMEGTLRRVLLVPIDAELSERLGFDHYYELVIFVPLKRTTTLMPGGKSHKAGLTFEHRYPVVFHVRDIPKGLQEGDRVHKTVRITGFFFKLCAYQSEYSLRAKDTDQWQRSPLFIGITPEIVPNTEAKPFISSTFLGILFLIGFLGMCLIFLAYYRSDKKFEAATRSQRFELEEGKSLNDLEIESSKGPDFSVLKEMDNPTTKDTQ